MGYGLLKLTRHVHSYDDLLEEEREEVFLALKRLSNKESYERVYRIRRATQLSIQHKLLPREEWTKPEEVRRSRSSWLGSRQWRTTLMVSQDTPYLSKIVADIKAEMAEKDALDSMEVIRKH